MTSLEKRVFDYDIALSFAGEDRQYVQQVAQTLDDLGTRVFYDEYVQAELWGEDLYVTLDEVYRKRARFAVIFVSRNYVVKPWTRHERQSAQARALLETKPYILPVRLDDSELPGLRPSVGYLDARRMTPQRLVELIQQKLSLAPGRTVDSLPAIGVPRDAGEVRELLARRPIAWEYMLYASIMWQRKQALDLKWRDHELGIARRTGRHVDDDAALKLIRHTTDDLQAVMRNLEKLFQPDVKERAFGAPGAPGDPERIKHLAVRIMDTYEEIMDLAAALRGIGVSSDLVPLMDATARLTDLPIRQYRSFVDQLVGELDQVQERVARGERVVIELVLKLEIDQTARANFDREVATIRRRRGLN